MLVPIAITASGAFQTDLWTTGFLTLAGWFLFVLGVGGQSRYDEAPHRYAGDCLWVVLPSRHPYGLVYILLSHHSHFHAVYNPRIQYEHCYADKIEAYLREGGTISDETQVPNIRPAMAVFSAAANLHDHQIKYLAQWIYQLRLQDSKGPHLAPPHDWRESENHRAEGTQLIGKNLMYALCHAKYLVYQRRHELKIKNPKDYWYEKESARPVNKDMSNELLKENIMKLRWKWERGWLEPTGRRWDPGMKGLCTAVAQEYQMFGIDIDECWKSGENHVIPKEWSMRSPSRIMQGIHGSTFAHSTSHSMEEYMGRLWDHCIETQETMFAALYACTCYWRDEVGNTAKGRMAGGQR